MTTSFEIREARPEEYETVGEIVVAAYRRLGPASRSADEYLAEMRRTADRAAVVPVLVAVAPSGEVVGTVTYVPGPGPYAESEREGEAGFRLLAVRPDAQGRGAGRALAEACIARARAEGRRGVAILTRPQMRVAHALYASLGFARAPEDDWEFEPGEWLWGFRCTF